MLDLFSGIGGFSLAASWVWGDELDIVSFCEIDKFCQKVLNKHWPNVPIHDDIKTLKGDQFGEIDIITGGFPCQPFSQAGKRRGSEDDRALWPEMLRIIKEARPVWVIGENVAGIVNMELDNYLADLEGQGYEVEAFIIPACAVDARHERKRVWIVANADATRQRGHGWQSKIEKIIMADDDSQCRQKLLRGNKLGNETKKTTSGWSNKKRRRVWEPEPKLGRVAHGIPNRVDRLKSLGNAIVPQVAAEIMFAIKKAMDNGNS